MRISKNTALQRIQDSAVDKMSALNETARKYFQVADSECKSIAEKGVTAGLIGNFQRIMDSDLGQNFTKSSDFGPYVMEVWPIVTAWYPDFPLKELISVQDMDKPLAYLFFSLLKAGTNKSDTVSGEVVETATGLRTIRGKYPTGEIVGETILPADLDTSGSNPQALLAYAPLNIATIPGYLEKTRIFLTAASTETYVPLSVSNGVITFAKLSAPTVATTLTVDVETGLIDFGSEATAGNFVKAVVNYVWNLDYADTDNIQRVTEEVELRPMEATPRALMLEWTLFSEYLKKSQFGQDIRTDNTKRVLKLLYDYQVRYILDEMFDYAEGNGGVPYNIVIPGTTAYALDVAVNNVIRQLKNAGNIIELTSGRMEGNKIVCGRNFKSFCESLPNTWWKPETDQKGFSAPRKIGTFAGFYDVYYDNTREATEAFMTYRGDEWYDAAYYLGEYMPIVPTDAIALGVKVRSSFVSMEAYRFDKKNCVLRLNVTFEGEGSGSSN